MKKIITIFLVLGSFIFLFNGCGKTLTASSPDISGMVNTLSSAFESNGFYVTYTHESKNILDGDRSIFTLTNGSGKETVQLFAYPSSAAAKEDISRLSDEGYTYTKPTGNTIETNNIGWVDAPHFYIKDTAIVLYVGSNDSIRRILCSICGEQVKGM